MSGEQGGYTFTRCPYPHCPLPEDHAGAHFLPKDTPPAEPPVTAAEAPDWHARYEGYAFRQIRRVRETMAAELERDRERGKKTPAELDRQAARLASYDDLITTLDHLKGQLK
jgi:hypothetical protein